MSSKPKTVPARRVQEPTSFHYLGDHPASLNVNSLKRVREEIDSVLKRFELLESEKRKPDLVFVPSTGGRAISFLEEIVKPDPVKPAIKPIAKNVTAVVMKKPSVSKPTPTATQRLIAMRSRVHRPKKRTSRKTR